MNDIYAELKKFFNQIDTVVVNEGKGAQGIKYSGKMFAMFYKGELTLKFSPERVIELIESGKGFPYDPGTGKPMKDRVLIPASKCDKWIELTQQSLEYVSKN
ncbi:MAG: MmcQ/YjbR family DNA-binding protein [Proteobacteria bacterium]|nr:MmcQ/YjbR family DNA-binding protein [Pseudomonadota bacterium]